MLVDGQRIANTTSGDSGLQYLNVDQIERVEVLRGSRSVIYGSDAIGGVIQIFTRRNAEQGLQPRLKLGFGSHQTLVSPTVTFSTALVISAVVAAVRLT